MGVGDIQGWILVLLSVAAFAMEVYAVVDCARTRADAFTAAGKLTKQKWLVIVVIAAALGFVMLPPPIGFGDSVLNIFGVIAVVASAVYLVDVRPAVRQIRGGGGGGRNSGPYGPW